MMKGAVSKHQSSIEKMIGAAGLVAEKVQVRGKDRVMGVVDVTSPAASSEAGPQLVEAMRMLRESMSFLSSFKNAVF